MGCTINTANRLGRPLVGICYAEAMVRAKRDLWPQRLLWPSASYQKAFRTRVEQLMGVIRVEPADSRQNMPETRLNRVHLGHETRLTGSPHPGEPK